MCYLLKYFNQLFHNWTQSTWHGHVEIHVTPTQGQYDDKVMLDTK